MSKIVKAVNVMVANPDWIADVIPAGEERREFFFLYKEKFKWSIVESSDKKIYYLHYYPSGLPLLALASMEEYEWSDFKEIISYSTNDLGGREAFQSFKELYEVVREKAFGMSSVLDEIISDDDLPF
ncbi:hypothetical protein [Dyella sp. 20L07]|uniref:hypothetical protein n=1 Tax=Dyella sp. 20L07 TaxID=3384240 RepID=UPI003D27B499